MASRPVQAEPKLLNPLETDQIDDGGRRWIEFVSFPEDAIALAKVSVVIIAQTAATILVLQIRSFTSSSMVVPFLAAALDVAAYLFCAFAILLRQSKPSAAGSLGTMGLAFAGISFVMMMGLILPRYLNCVVLVPCLVLLSVSVMSFMKKCT